MKESELRKLIRSKIEAGIGHQQVYDELHGKGNIADEELADLVRYVPTMERRANYKTAQLALLGLLALAFVWKLGFEVPAAVQKGMVHVVFHAVWCVGYLICFIGVAKYWRRAHSFAGVLGMLIVFRSTSDKIGSMEGIQLLVLLIPFALAVLGIYLQRKLTPAYITMKESYVNAEGQNRLRQVVCFGD